ncbi:M81 family metallopeptidase [Microbacterium sp. zg-YB36]|uniref:M81 family metallopeptidase n=1 Tax=Microbacterium sp. zg-YB36 TaxID=2969407 RepID=UPI00214C80CD|nr:M81 family metallopeptidase [Microbacterium sp. zg-YB36]MDL5353133.1 M81 family metallopeptidase [Microbacterium sp. zg-YB36]
MTLRFFTGGINHETNSFSKVPADEHRFRLTRYGRGAEILERFRGTRTVYGGFLTAAETNHVTLTSTVSSFAQPSGPVVREEFERQMALTLEDLREALRTDGVDGIVLGLHGAMVVAGIEDGEGEYLARVREVVGPDVPIGVELDLHANISPRMAELADILIGYDTYPHVDQYDRAIELLTLVARTVRGEISPTSALRKLPILAHMTVQNTASGPMADWLALCHEIEARPGVLTATITGGFPYADIPDVGMAAYVVTDGLPELATQYANELSEFAWARRTEFQPRLTSVDDAIRAASSSPGPIILADVADNTGAGASGDDTEILRALIAHGANSAVLVPMYDPGVVAEAVRAGVGATITTTIGGKVDDGGGAPLEIEAYVRTITDGWYSNYGPMSTGSRTGMGLTAVLEIGGHDGIEVVCSSVQRSPHDLQMLRSVGIEPTRRQIIVVKSSVHYRADFGPIATEIFEVDAAGLAAASWARLDFQNLRRPIFPLDPDMEWTAQ